MQHTQSLSELEMVQAWSCAPDEFRYGLLDGTTQNGTSPNPAFDDFFHLAPTADYFPLFLGTEYEECLPGSPYLIALGNEHRPYLNDQGCVTANDIWWFSSPLGLDSLVPFFQSITNVILPNGNSALFRYWSGLILLRLLSTLEADQTAQLLPPMGTLWLPNQQNKLWHRFEISNVDTHLEPKPSPWWTIPPEALTAFEASATHIQASEVEDLLWRAYPNITAQTHPAAIGMHVQNAVQVAPQLGLQSQNSIMMLSALMIKQNIGFEAFMNQPLLATVWGKSDTETRFSEEAGRILN